MTEFQKWFAARARNPDRITLEEAYQAGLQAKIESMERQELVAKVESWTNGSYTRHYKLKWLRDVNEGAKLYALPGAKGDEK